MEINNNRTITNPVIKDKITFIKTAKDTNGELTWLSIELAPNGGNDLHYHDKFEETFIAINGTLGVTFEGEEMTLQAGESVTVPINSVHRFYNPNAHPIQFEVKITPASRNLEEFLQIMYGLARDGKTNKKSIPTNLYHIGAISLLGETFPPKKTLLHRMSFFFNWLGKRAKKNGELEKLRLKYVQF